MSGKQRAVFAWSSGKDSAWALHVLRQRVDVEIVGLLTTVNTAADRVAMHAVRRILVELQAESLKLPLTIVDLPWPCSNADYEHAMFGALDDLIQEYGITAIAFGDLFLEDIRAYREKQFANTDLELLFPIWEMPTAALAREMIASGLKAQVICIDPKQTPREFAGRGFDAEFLDELPASVDPCGEHGEFHTFVFDGPMFTTPIDITVGETIERDGFVFTDIKPVLPAGRHQK